MGFKSGKDSLTELEVASEISSKPVVSVVNTNDDANAGYIRFTKNGGNAADDDTLGTVDFYGENDNGTPESIQYASILAQSSDVTDGSENGVLTLSAMNGGTLREYARVNPESFTANTFCGGLGFKRPVFTGADGTLSHAMSGCVVIVGDGDDLALPIPIPGLHYTLINGAGTSSTAAIITATSDGSTDGRTIIFGQLIDNNGDQLNFADKMKINFSTSSTVGDRVELICLGGNPTNGAETWYAICHSDANDGITLATS